MVNKPQLTAKWTAGSESLLLQEQNVPFTWLLPPLQLTQTRLRDDRTCLSHTSKTHVRNNSKRVQHQLTSHHHCWVLVLALSASLRSGKITWSLQQSAAAPWPLQHLLNASMSFALGFLQNFYSQCICIWKNTWFLPERNKQNMRNLLQVWLPLWETTTKRSYFHLLPINR